VKEFNIKKVAVLGAGVMGAQIAAHLVNANVETILFELPAKEGDPNGNVKKALAGLKKLDPAPISTPDKLSYIEPANYDQHLEKLRGCDLVIEAIAERMDWKSDLYRKVAPFLKEDAIFATNTSGLSINKLAEAFPEVLRHRFCGIHFFNPPRYMYLVELIPCEGTDASLLAPLESFLVSTVGKGVVRAKDTPNFIANRVGVFSMLATMHHAQRLGLGFDTVDALTGRYLGRPKSATFRTLDLVGLDVFSHVVKTMEDNLGNDSWHDYFQTPEWMNNLIENGALGQKTKCGVYKKVKKEIQVLDLKSGEYRISDGKADDDVKGMLRERDWSVKLEKLRNSDNPQAQFVWSILRDGFHYCAVQLESIADNARDLDLAVRWGFGWDSGPFEIWQAAGWQQVAGWINDDIAAGATLSSEPLPAWVTDSSRSGVHNSQGSYAPASDEVQPRSALPVYKRQLYPDALLGESRDYGETIFQNDAVRLWHTGDGIAILGFNTKMHAISNEVLDGVLRAVDEAEENFSALVLWQTEPPFSAGAHLLQLMQGVQESRDDSGMMGKFKRAATRVKYTAAGGGGMGDILNAAAGSGPRVEEVVAKFQQTSMRLKYAQVPTIAAVDGLALGGGCEFAIHCTRTVATLESYMGLVEVGVGLLPAGGGCKEMTQRAAAQAQGEDIFPILRRYFETIAMGEVAKSAEMARAKGFLRQSDRVVMNRFELLHVAKQEALALNSTSYRPPLRQHQIPVAGRTTIATFKASMINMLEGGFISEHDYNIGCRVAETLCGGDVEVGSMVDEEWLLDLERRNFMELLATEKTQARIEHMLKTGKPLRN
jgi:3-hydroxyacyl-CoA dehydrogenase